MTKKSIEDLFKDSFEDFEAEVSPSVWENIKTGLKGAGIGLLGKTLINKIGTNALIAVVSSAVTIVATVNVMNWTNSAVKKTSADNTIIVGKEPVKPVVVEAINKSVTQTSVAETKVSGRIDDLSKNNSTPETKVTLNGQQDAQETKIIVEPFQKKDKKKIETVISKFSGIQIASIFASPIGGTVPLIVNLSNNGNGVVNNWNYGDGKKEDKVANPVHVFETPGTYTVTLTSTDANGKTTTDSREIEVTGNSSMSKPPTELTPNGDGINDVFCFNGKNIIKMNGQIFDRRGKVIFECDKVGAKWDGKGRKGEEATEGLYFYIETAEGKDGKFYEQKGSIILTR